MFLSLLPAAGCSRTGRRLGRLREVSASHSQPQAALWTGLAKQVAKHVANYTSKILHKEGKEQNNIPVPLRPGVLHLYWLSQSRGSCIIWSPSIPQFIDIPHIPSGHNFQVIWVFQNQQLCGNGFAKTEEASGLPMKRKTLSHRGTYWKLLQVLFWNLHI